MQALVTGSGDAVVEVERGVDRSFLVFRVSPRVRTEQGEKGGCGMMGVGRVDGGKHKQKSGLSCLPSFTENDSHLRHPGPCAPPGLGRCM